MLTGNAVYLAQMQVSFIKKRQELVSTLTGIEKITKLSMFRRPLLQAQHYKHRLRHWK
jgi:hypothetical protein